METLLEKEKMLLTSIFFFSHNVLYPLNDKLYIFSYIYFVICACFQTWEV